MRVERFGVVTVRAGFAVQHGQAGLHPPGMGLDLFFDRHDSESAKFVGGVPRNDQSAPPLFRSPRTKITHVPRCATNGGGVLFCFLGAGSQEAGLPRRRGSSSANLRPSRHSSLQEFRAGLADSPAAVGVAGLRVDTADQVQVFVFQRVEIDRFQFGKRVVPDFDPVAAELEIDPEEEP